MITITVTGDKLDEVHEMLDRMNTQEDDNEPERIALSIATARVLKENEDIKKAMEVLLNDQTGNKKARQASKRVDK